MFVAATKGRLFVFALRTNMQIMEPLGEWGMVSLPVRLPGCRGEAGVGEGRKTAGWLTSHADITHCSAAGR